MRSWRGPAAHGVVLLIALLAAYRAWTRPQAAPKLDSSVTLWEGTAESVSLVEYVGERRYAKIERRKDGGEGYLWVTVERERSSPAKEKQLPATEEREPTKSAFVGGTSSERILEQMAAPTAVRALGKLDADRKKDLGLDDPKASVTVTTKGQRHELKLGSKVYGGSERYVLNPRSNEVFVLRGNQLRDLEVGETSLMQRDLHRFKVEEIKGARIAAGDRSREIVRLEGSAKADEWADSKTPADQDDAASSWMTRVAQLRALEYVTEDADLAALSFGEGAPEDVFRVDFTGEGGKALGYLELFRMTGKDKPEYLARTEATRVRVKVAQRVGENLEQDLANVLTY